MRRALCLFLAACNFGTLAELGDDEAAAAPMALSRATLALFRHYDAPDEEIATRTLGLDEMIDAAGSPPHQLSIGPLGNEDGARVGATRDASRASGVLAITELPCPLDEVERIVLATNQSDFYPSTWEMFSRRFVTPVSDYLARTTSRIEWESVFVVTVFGHRYESIVPAVGRRLPNGSPSGGPLFFVRRHMPAPARFFEPSDDTFWRQDYQVELFYERSAGRTVHLTGRWLELSLNGLPSSDPIAQSLILGNTVDFDTRLGIACSKKTPVPQL